MPAAGMFKYLSRLPLYRFGEVETGGEMTAFTAHDNTTNALGRIREKGPQLIQRAIVDGITLFRAAKCQIGQLAFDCDIDILFAGLHVAFLLIVCDCTAIDLMIFVI